MFTEVCRPSGPSELLRCNRCGKVFYVDRQEKINTVEVMTLTATDSRGGQALTPWLAPKCPECGAHRESDPAPAR